MHNKNSEFMHGAEQSNDILERYNLYSTSEPDKLVTSKQGEKFG